MIVVTRLDKQQMYLNPDHIICIEETPDTVITLFNGNRYIVVDRASTIISRIVSFRARISRRASAPAARRCLGRSPAHRFDRPNDLLKNFSADSPGEPNHTPFHSRDY
ncbi:MAG: flagellar FlbD family protein [Desulfuromonadaceae bacterium]|nr:flagellar FlbD family protein [Desulfuromonadaceae bacterium]